MAKKKPAAAADAASRPRIAVRLLTARVGNNFSQRPGEVIEVADDEARRMIDGHLAEPVRTAAGRKPKPAAAVSIPQEPAVPQTGEPQTGVPQTGVPQTGE